MSQPRLFEEFEDPDLGFPMQLQDQPDQFKKHWDNLDAEADEKVLSLFPILTKPPDATPQP